MIAWDGKQEFRINHGADGARARGPPAEGAPRAEHIFLRQRELVVGFALPRTGHVYRDLKKHCQQVK